MPTSRAGSGPITDTGGAPRASADAKLPCDALVTRAFANAVGFWDVEVAFCQRLARAVPIRVPSRSAKVCRHARCTLLRSRPCAMSSVEEEAHTRILAEVLQQQNETRPALHGGMDAGHPDRDGSGEPLAERDLDVPEADRVRERAGHERVARELRVERARERRGVLVAACVIEPDQEVRAVAALEVDAGQVHVAHARQSRSVRCAAAAQQGIQRRGRSELSRVRGSAAPRASCSRSKAIRPRACAVFAPSRSVPLMRFLRARDACGAPIEVG